MDISVIIPIYNTDIIALERCFSSFAFGDNISYEVLLVDDGSNEDTGNFCKSYAEKHQTFTYIYKENGGVSSARNLGIRKAKGRYVTFVDSDDVFIPNEKMDSLLNSDYDIVIFDYVKEVKGKTKLISIFNRTEGLVPLCDCCKHAVVTDKLNLVTAKFLSRSMLQTGCVQFDEDMLSGEDYCFILDALSCCQSVFYSTTAAYKYFLDYGTYSQRVEKKFERVVSSRDKRIAKKCDFIKFCGLTNDEASEIFRQINAEETNVLFSWAADLSSAGLLSVERQKLIAERAEALADVENLKSKIKLFIIRHRLWNLLALVSKARARYLLVKRN